MGTLRLSNATLPTHARLLNNVQTPCKEFIHLLFWCFFRTHCTIVNESKHFLKLRRVSFTKLRNLRKSKDCNVKNKWTQSQCSYDHQHQNFFFTSIKNWQCRKTLLNFSSHVESLKRLCLITQLNPKHQNLEKHHHQPLQKRLDQSQVLCLMKKIQNLFTLMNAFLFQALKLEARIDLASISGFGNIYG